MKELNFKSISEFHKANNLPDPENPLFSIIHTELTEDEKANCEDEEDNEPVSVTTGFYSISFKNIISGEIAYGRTKYDCVNGTILLTAPNQTLVFKDMVFSSEAWHIAIHKDFLRGYDLLNKIKKYHFFDYNVNEALHLSPSEEATLKSIFANIQAEYHNNQDELTKEIILSHLETLFKYIDRFYKRQFLHRKEVNTELATRFNNILDDYYATNQIEEKGIPTVDWIASQLGVSHRYMSDSIKAETGKTAIDQINLSLIDEAKTRLLNPEKTVSEVAYELGFEYPAYFSRLFKNKVGLSPKSYIKQQQLN